MDADDVSMPNRFERQLGFLNAHPEIGVIGSAVILIDRDGGKIKKLAKPETTAELKWQALFSTPLIHPTVFGRVEIFRENPYDENLYNSEDYELWSRFIFDREVMLANIPEPLLYYRIYPESFTRRLDSSRRSASMRNTISNIERYIGLSEKDKEALLKQEVVATFGVYRRAAREFARKEGYRPGLFPVFFLLLKYQLRNFITHRF